MILREVMRTKTESASIISRAIENKFIEIAQIIQNQNHENK